jgi:hypothetical protein
MKWTVCNSTQKHATLWGSSSSLTKNQQRTTNRWQNCAQCLLVSRHLVKYCLGTASKGNPFYSLQQESVACPKLCQHMLNSAIISLLNKDFFLYKNLGQWVTKLLSTMEFTVCPHHHFTNCWMGSTHIAVLTSMFSIHSVNYTFQLQIVGYLTNYIIYIRVH